jgi:hypothetical protein
MENAIDFSTEAEEMHAGAPDYEERQAVQAEMNTPRIPKGFLFEGNFDDSFISSEQAEWEAGGRDASEGWKR